MLTTEQLMSFYQVQILVAIIFIELIAFNYLFPRHASQHDWR